MMWGLNVWRRPVRVAFAFVTVLHATAVYSFGGIGPFLHSFQFRPLAGTALQTTEWSWRGVATSPHAPRPRTDGRIVGLHASTSAESGRHSSKESQLMSKKDRIRARRADGEQQKFGHTVAVLTVPSRTSDYINNERILAAAVSQTLQRLSVVVRRTSSSVLDTSTETTNMLVPSTQPPSVAELRSYVGELYSTAWDLCCDVSGSQGLSDSVHNEQYEGYDDAEEEEDGDLFLDVVIYAQGLPNVAPEAWLYRLPDIDCVCSSDEVTGWVSTCGIARGSTKQSGDNRGLRYVQVEGGGRGGLDEHVAAINEDRKSRGLDEVAALCVSTDMSNDNESFFLDDPSVFFLEDDDNVVGLPNDSASSTLFSSSTQTESRLYQSVAVGGTFDGLHYGHRKLLTLAVSCVDPASGVLLVGVTMDEMLSHKEDADLIPCAGERVRGVRQFLDGLAPGMKNRVRIVVIRDAYGPPGATEKEIGEVYPTVRRNNFDALVLSHETLPTGRRLNEHRVRTLNLEPLALLCTRRTQSRDMSSTAIRRLRRRRRRRRQAQRSGQGLLCE